MSDFIQQLNSLASVSSLTQLKLDTDGELEKRSTLSTLGHRIMDAFRCLSSAGRTAITARNGELLSAMQKAVDGSKHHIVADVRTASGKLATTLDKLQNHINKGTYFAQIKGELINDTRFASLPETSKNALKAALENMKDPYQGATPSEWKDCATALKWAFFGERPAGLDMESGIKNFADSLKEGFLKPTQQSKIKGGFHSLTYKDFERGAIKQVGNTPTPPRQSEAYYKEALTDLLGYNHIDFLPFVSTVITQNGIGTVSMQLPRDSGHDIYRYLSYTTTGLNSAFQNDNVTLRREGDTLVVDATYDYGFLTSGVAGKGCSQISTVTMRIDLAAEPERHMVNGKEVLIPQFTLENVSTAFNNPVDIIKDDPRLA